MSHFWQGYKALNGTVGQIEHPEITLSSTHRWQRQVMHMQEQATLDAAKGAPKDSQVLVPNSRHVGEQLYKSSWAGHHNKGQQLAFKQGAR